MTNDPDGRQPWTWEQTTMLRRMLAANASRKEIAAATGRTYNSVRSTIRRMQARRIKDEIAAGARQPVAAKPPQKSEAPDGLPKTAVEADPYARSTRLHLQDIHREHGFNASWLTLNIGNEPTSRKRFYPALVVSPIGSSAAMCAETV